VCEVSFPDNVSGASVGPIFTGHESERKKSRWENSPRTSCKNPVTKNQYLFHGESLKSSCMTSF
jgi:hypothetical protein